MILPNLYSGHRQFYAGSDWRIRLSAMPCILYVAVQRNANFIFWLIRPIPVRHVSGAHSASPDSADSELSRFPAEIGNAEASIPVSYSEAQPIPSAACCQYPMRRYPTSSIWISTDLLSHPLAIMIQLSRYDGNYFTPDPQTPESVQSAAGSLFFAVRAPLRIPSPPTYRSPLPTKRI